MQQYQPISEELLVIVALLTIIIGLIRNLLRQWTPEAELLDRHFVKGELSIEEYQESKEKLAQEPAAFHARDFVARAFRSQVAAYKNRMHYLVAD